MDRMFRLQAEEGFRRFKKTGHKVFTQGRVRSEFDLCFVDGCQLVGAWVKLGLVEPIQGRVGQYRIVDEVYTVSGAAYDVPKPEMGGGETNVPPRPFLGKTPWALSDGMGEVIKSATDRMNSKALREGFQSQAIGAVLDHRRKVRDLLVSETPPHAREDTLTYWQKLFDWGYITKAELAEQIKKLEEFYRDEEPSVADLHKNATLEAEAESRFYSKDKLLGEKSIEAAAIALWEDTKVGWLHWVDLQPCTKKLFRRRAEILLTAALNSIDEKKVINDE